MKQWADKMKRLFHSDKSEQQKNAENIDTPTPHTQQQQKPNSIFKALFFTDKKQKHQLHSGNEDKSGQYNLQPKLSCAQFSQMGQQQLNSNQIDQNNNNAQRDDDEDSLGYTQNQWDQQTINFQLQDRMLDCLEDERHVSGYRQSLIQNSNMRKTLENRYNKPSRIFEEEAQHQISIQAICEDVSQHVPLNQVKNSIKEKKKAQRKNRFSKYKKKAQQESMRQSSKSYWKGVQIGNLSPQFEAKVKELTNLRNQLNCEDFITQVFKVESPKKVQISEIKLSQMNEQIHSVAKFTKSKKEHIEEVQTIQINTQNQNNGTDKVLNNKQNHKQVQISSSLEIVQVPKNLQFLSDESNENILGLDKNQGKQENFGSQEVNQTGNQHINKTQFGKDLNQKHENNSKQNFNQDNSLQNDNRQIKISQSPFSQNGKKETQDSSNKKDSIQTISKRFHVLSPKGQRQQQVFRTLPIPFQPMRTTKQANLKNRAQSSREEIPEPTLNNNSEENNNNLDFKKTNQQKKMLSPLMVNFNGSEQVTNFVKTPRGKISFNYVNSSNQSKEPVNLFANKKQSPQISQNKVIQNTFSINQQVKIQSPIKIQQTQIPPIFLERLFRLIQKFPNLQDTSMINFQEIRFQFFAILNTMKSAISVIELLYKKLIIQKNRLQELFIKIDQSRSLSPIHQAFKQQLDSQIYDFFVNSQWQSYVIEQIDYIKPKTAFSKRSLNPPQVDIALKSYNQFVSHYLVCPIAGLSTQQEKDRYTRIRSKIFEIVKYLKLISQDLYSLWLFDCNYPKVYHEYLNYLKRPEGSLKGQALNDEILAKLLLGQQYNDPLSLSVIGQIIMEKAHRSFA